MLLAIALQESRMTHRRQANFGPARSFWQFEKGGVRGVMKHKLSRDPLEHALRTLRYEAQIGQTALLHQAIENNDVLACIFARLLLWTLPDALPGQHAAEIAWAQYLSAWRPGKPHRETWDALYSEAWVRVRLEGKA